MQGRFEPAWFYGREESGCFRISVFSSDAPIAPSAHCERDRRCRTPSGLQALSRMATSQFRSAISGSTVAARWAGI